ncbi:MAG: SAM-dependent methyltransferase [Crocinitomicaceae bacterium]|nr:SAM-dependent methyltransferase [Crocinitomicaceae bacterium]
MPKSPQHKWYETWFDSPHYHRLYGHRNTKEASTFIKGLHHKFGWKRLQLLDLACGKGRHSAAAAGLGHSVVGMDLSPNSIADAKKIHTGTSNLRFVEGNMLDFDLGERFDGVLNLFTSFGYFDNLSDHLAVLKRIRHHLNVDGFLILDFLNVEFSLARLIPSETLNRGGVDYIISRSFGDLGHGIPGFIKTIEFEEDGTLYSFTERVSGMDRVALTSLLAETGFVVFDTFGNYDLSDWKPKESPRLILCARALDTGFSSTM